MIAFRTACRALAACLEDAATFRGSRRAVHGVGQTPEIARARREQADSLRAQARVLRAWAEDKAEYQGRVLLPATAGYLTAVAYGDREALRPIERLQGVDLWDCLGDLPAALRRCAEARTY